MRLRNSGLGDLGFFISPCIKRAMERMIAWQTGKYTSIEAMDQALPPIKCVGLTWQDIAKAAGFLVGVAYIVPAIVGGATAGAGGAAAGGAISTGAGTAAGASTAAATLGVSAGEAAAAAATVSEMVVTSSVLAPSLLPTVLTAGAIAAGAAIPTLASGTSPAPEFSSDVPAQEIIVEAAPIVPPVIGAEVLAPALAASVIASPLLSSAPATTAPQTAPEQSIPEDQGPPKPEVAKVSTWDKFRDAWLPLIKKYGLKYVTDRLQQYALEKMGRNLSPQEEAELRRQLEELARLQAELNTLQANTKLAPNPAREQTIPWGFLIAAGAFLFSRS